MFLNVTQLFTYSFQVIDGPGGRLIDMYFDDDRWGVRYLICRLGPEGEHRDVLVSPLSVTEINSREKKISLILNQKGLELSPDYDEKVPISRQYEEELSQKYDFPQYWITPGLYSVGMEQAVILDHLKQETEKNVELHGEGENSHLRSARELLYYKTEAVDGSAGRVDDFQIHYPTWDIRWLIIQRGILFFKKKKKINIKRIDNLSWAEGSITLLLTKDALREIPEM